MEEIEALIREKERRMTEPQREHHRFVMSKIQLFNESSTRHLSNRELQTILNDIYALIEKTFTFDKKCVYLNEEISKFWNLRKSYDLRVHILVNRKMDTKGMELIKQMSKRVES